MICLVEITANQPVLIPSTELGKEATRLFSIVLVPLTKAVVEHFFLNACALNEDGLGRNTKKGDYPGTRNEAQ